VRGWGTHYFGTFSADFRESPRSDWLGIYGLDLRSLGKMHPCPELMKKKQINLK